MQQRDPIGLGPTHFQWSDRGTIYHRLREWFIMDKRSLVLIAIIGFILVTGCTSSKTAITSPIPDPAAPAPVVTSMEVPTDTPTPVPTSIFLYEKNGRYYRQPLNFVCTEPNPTYIGGREGLVGIWCEKGNVVPAGTGPVVTETGICAAASCR